MTNRVLITGGLGYVGGRISRHLASNPDWTLRLTSRQQVVPHPAWLEKGEMVTWNIAADIGEICSDVDTIIHLAALNEIDCAKDSLAALEVNGMGTLRLLQAAQTSGVRRFIYFSTAHIYGAPLVNNISEQTVPRPIHPYAITHKVAEDFVLAAGDQGKIEAIVLRLSNGFGVPIDAEVNRWTLLVNDLCRQAVSTGKLVLRSNGLQQRDFVTLHDAARCVAHFIALPWEECRDGLFNLGGEYSLSIFEMTQLVAARCQVVLGFLPAIERIEPNPSDKSSGLDYSIAKLKSTGFHLQGQFEEEIDSTLLLCKQAFGGS
jgi:UDP-glucose 4-epimerase